MEPKFQLIVKVKSGLIVRDRPAPESRGALKMRTEPVGKVLMAYAIMNVEGVDYAALIPQNPLRPEWVRVAEADHSIEYVDVIRLNVPESGSDSGDIVNALHRIAAVLEQGLKK